MIELKIKTKEGEKTFNCDDVPFGVLEEVLKLDEVKTDKEAMKVIPDILQLLFPDMTENDVKYVGIKQFRNIIQKEVKKLINPIEEELKN